MAWFEDAAGVAEPVMRKKREGGGGGGGFIPPGEARRSSGPCGPGRGGISECSSGTRTGFPARPLRRSPGGGGPPRPGGGPGEGSERFFLELQSDLLQKGMGDEHMEHVAMPAVPGAMLVVVHAEERLGLEERPLDGPAELRDRDQGLNRDGFGGVGEDVLGGVGLVLGLGPEEEERLWGARRIIGCLGHPPDREAGDKDPLHPEGVGGTKDLRPDYGACEDLHRDGSLGQERLRGTSSPALGLWKDPGRLFREDPGVGTDRGHVGEILRERFKEGPGRSEEGVDANPAGLEETGGGRLFQEFGGDLRLGGKRQGVG